jgi:hypothetical protein
VILPIPLAADHLTTVSLSLSETIRKSMISSNFYSSTSSKYSLSSTSGYPFKLFLLKLFFFYYYCYKETRFSTLLLSLESVKVFYIFSNKLLFPLLYAHFTALGLK